MISKEEVIKELKKNNNTRTAGDFFPINAKRNDIHFSPNINKIFIFDGYSWIIRRKIYEQ